MTNNKPKAPVPGGCTGPACRKPHDPTPQAREGPFGPKTLCNACGVHYIRCIKKQPLHQQDVAREAAFHVFSCYQTSPECGASLPLHPNELLRRIRTLKDAMLVATAPPAAAVAAPGTPPQAAAAAAAPEWSDAGSQEEEEVEVPLPARLKVTLSEEDKEDPDLCQYVEEAVEIYNTRMLEASELLGADRTAAQEEQAAALVLKDIYLATHQVAQHSPNTLELKRGLEEQQQEEADEQDYHTPRAAAPKRARTGPRMPRHHHQQQQQQKVPFLALPPGLLTIGEGLGEDKAGAAGAAAGNNHNVVAAPQQQVAAGGMEVAGGAGAGVGAGLNQPPQQQQQQQQQEDVVMAAAAVPAHASRHSGRASRPPKKLEAFVRSPAEEVFRRV